MYPSIIALVILIIFSGYFSATETAFSALNRIKIKNLANNGNKKAKLTLELCDKYDKLISTILIGNNIVNILSTSLATALFVAKIGDKGVAASTVVMTIVVLIFGEVGPKSIAKELPEKFAMFSAPYINFICKILTPLTLFFVWLKRGLSKILGIKGENSITNDELLTIVKEAQSDGAIAAEEGDLIKSAIEFYDLDANDILIPRINIVAVENVATPEEINEVFRSSGFSRIPVYDDTIDNIIGLINHKDFIYDVMDGGKKIEDVIKPVVFISSNMKISNLLTLLQKKKTHLAVVADEYGGTEGLVTLEDVIEELVGEIWDEHDEVIIDYTKLGENLYRFSCNAGLDKIEDVFGIDVDTENSSIGGWVMEALEKIPQEKDTFSYENLTITVTKADKRRAIEVIISKEDKNEDESDE